MQREIVAAVVAADKGKANARCAAGFGRDELAAFNRRFRMREGFTMTHPGQGNPDILEPAGPIDPQVGVLGAWSAEGRFLGCVVNFSCHATTGPGGISADWIYYLEKTIRGLMGDKAVVVFVQGTSGDVTQVDNRSPYQIKQFGEISARYVGGRVGAEAIKTLLAIEQTAEPLTPIAAQTQVLKIKRRAPKPDSRGPPRCNSCSKTRARSTAPSGPLPRKSSCWTRGSRKSRSPTLRCRPCR